MGSTVAAGGRLVTVLACEGEASSPAAIVNPKGFPETLRAPGAEHHIHLTLSHASNSLLTRPTGAVSSLAEVWPAGDTKQRGNRRRRRAATECAGEFGGTAAETTAAPAARAAGILAAPAVRRRRNRPQAVGPPRTEAIVVGDSPEISVVSLSCVEMPVDYRDTRSAYVTSSLSRKQRAHCRSRGRL